jgi:hypothetical protein
VQDRSIGLRDVTLVPASEFTAVPSDIERLGGFYADAAAQLDKMFAEPATPRPRSGISSPRSKRPRRERSRSFARQGAGECGGETGEVVRLIDGIAS